MLLADRLSILEGDWRERADKSAESCLGDRYSGDKSRPTFHPEGWRARHILSLLCHYLFLVVNVLHITIDSAQLFFKGPILLTYHFSPAPTHIVSHLYHNICKN